MKKIHHLFILKIVLVLIVLFLLSLAVKSGLDHIFGVCRFLGGGMLYKTCHYVNGSYILDLPRTLPELFIAFLGITAILFSLLRHKTSLFLFGVSLFIGIPIVIYGYELRMNSVNEQRLIEHIEKEPAIKRLCTTPLTEIRGKKKQEVLQQLGEPYLTSSDGTEIFYRFENQECVLKFQNDRLIDMSSVEYMPEIY